MTDEIKNKISKSLSGIVRSESFREKQRNKKFPKESNATKRKLSKSIKMCKYISNLRGKKLSKEICDQRRKTARKLAECNFYKFISPGGTIHITNNFCEFLEIHNLHKGCIFRVIRGERPHHKGWSAVKLDT